MMAGEFACRSDISLEILLQISEPMHKHSELELLYVIDGTCEVTLENEIYALGQDDMLLVNTNFAHKITVSPESMVAKFTVSYFALCSRMKEEFLLFQCNSQADYGYKYTNLRKIIQDILMEYAGHEETQSYRQQGLSYILISHLVNDFKLNGHAAEKQEGWAQNQRLAYILNYVEMHYDSSVSLSDIADRLYLSASSLSRFFTKMMGESFVKYVRTVRLKKVVEKLIYTDIPVTRVAVESGFSNPSAMNKDFKEYYGLTPTEYRKKYQASRTEEEKKQIIYKKQRLQELLEVDNKQTNGKSGREKIKADILKTNPCKEWKNKLINVSPICDLESASLQKHILMLHGKLHFHYIRVWSLFSKNMMLVDEGKGLVNFEKLDRILDFCVENDINLFLDMGQRTNVAMSSERNYLYKTEEGIPFEGKEEWESLLRKFLRHIVKRYGEKTVSEWVFEFTFFLNERPSYASPCYSTLEVWESGFEAVREIIPKAKIAGPGLIAIPDYELLKKLLDQFFLSKYKPDIFTTVNFPYGNRFGAEAYVKLSDANYMQREIKIVHTLLKEYGFQGKHYITEWNNSLANRNYVQDSCYRGTFIIKSVLDNYPHVDAMGFWYASDLINVHYDSDSILTGSGGMITKDKICKPAFWAFSFLSSMGGHLVKKGDNYLITQNSSRDIQILCYNNNNLNAKYFMVEENTYKPEDLRKLFQNRDMLYLEIQLEHLEWDAEYSVRQKVINEERGSVLNKWMALGCEKDMLPEDIQYLRQTCIPEVEITRRCTDRGRLLLDVSLAPHEMRWISIVCE